MFTWSNGFQHASAVAATALGSYCMTKRQAVAIICLFEIAGAMLGGSAVADAVRSLCKWPEEPSLLPILCSALLAAIIWNFMARKVKMPASSTHALLGGIIGALVAAAPGLRYVEMGRLNLLHPTGVVGAVVSLFLSPVLGFVVAFGLYHFVILVCLRANNRINKTFKSLQFFTTALLAFGDGQNDTQKTMGLAVLALNAAGYLVGTDIPLWVRALIAVAMGAGAFFMSPGLVSELARHVYKLSRLHACVAEASGAAVLIANSLVGGPVSSSQVIAASIVGGAVPQRLGGVHWQVVRNILLSWLVTIPTVGLLAAIIYTCGFRWFGNLG
ncbi:MAG TPA: inorganic phosphate transporter [Oculatellaceae cyanobacterium]